MGICSDEYGKPRKSFYDGTTMTVGTFLENRLAKIPYDKIRGWKNGSSSKLTIQDLQKMDSDKLGWFTTYEDDYGDEEDGSPCIALLLYYNLQI